LLLLPPAIQEQVLLGNWQGGERALRDCILGLSSDASQEQEPDQTTP